MKEEVEKEVVNKADQIFDLILQGIEGTIDLAKTELPQVLEEYIHYFIVQELPFASISWMVLSCIVTIIIFKFAKRYETEVYPENHYHCGRRTCKSETFEIIKWITLGLLGFILAAALSEIIDSSKNIYLLKNAPKAYLIEKARK